METTENQNKPTRPQTYLALAIVSTILCCLPLGIVSIVYAAKVNGAYAEGDYEGAQKASNNAKTWGIAAIAVGAIGYIIYFLFFGFAFLGALGSA